MVLISLVANPKLIQHLCFVISEKQIFLGRRSYEFLALCNWINVKFKILKNLNSNFNMHVHVLIPSHSFFYPLLLMLRLHTEIARKWEFRHRTIAVSSS